MSTHTLLRRLLRARLSEGGFAIPVAIALGLLMVLLGLINIIKSQEEDLISISQTQSNKALSAAEAGVTQLRELIQRNKPLAIFDSASWTTTGRTLCDSAANIGTEIAGWRSVNTNDPSLGEYRLISYDYSLTDGANPTTSSTGTLIVEGRVDEAISRLQLVLPVRPEDPQDFKPALWLGQGAKSGSTVVDREGNILVKDTTQTGCKTPTQPTVDNLNNPQTQYVLGDSRNLPSLPAEPSPINTISATDLAAATELPRSGDTPNAQNYYIYSVTGELTLANQTLEISTGTKVILYLNGNLTLNATTGNLSINSNNSSAYLEIYGKSSTSIVKFAGPNAITVNALIHAPDATVQLSDNPTITINGAMWVNNWSGGSSNPITIGLDTTTVGTTTTSSYASYASKPADNSNPQTGVPTDWQVVQGN